MTAMTREDQEITLAQMLKHRGRGYSLAQEHLCSNPAWGDAFLMKRLTELRHNFQETRLRMASGVED